MQQIVKNQHMLSALVPDFGFAKIIDRQYVHYAVGTFLKNWDFRHRNFQNWDFDVREVRQIEFCTNLGSTKLIMSLDEVDHELTTQLNAMRLNDDEEHGLTVPLDPSASALQRSVLAVSLIEDETEVEIDAVAHFNITVYNEREILTIIEELGKKLPSFNIEILDFKSKENLVD